MRNVSCPSKMDKVWELVIKDRYACAKAVNIKFAINRQTSYKIKGLRKESGGFSTCKRRARQRLGLTEANLSRIKWTNRWPRCHRTWPSPPGTPAGASKNSTASPRLARTPPYWRQYWTSTNLTQPRSCWTAWKKGMRPRDFQRREQL